VAVGIVTTLWSPKWRWLTITCLWVGVAVLLQWGLLQVEPPMSFWDRIYLTPSIFSLGFSDELAAQDWRIQVARFLGPVIFATTFFAAVATVLRTQVSRARLRFAKGHVVVAGLGDKGSRLALSLHAAGRRVVAIESDPANPQIAPLRRRGITVLDGDAADPEVLREVNIRRAAQLVAICDADGTNAEIVDAARRVLIDGGRAGDPLRCSVHLRDAQLSRLLRTRELASDGDPVRYDFFNTYQRGARRWLTEAAPFDADPQGRAPYLVVVGLTDLGESLVVAAAQRWLDLEAAGAGPLGITVVDPDAARRSQALRWQHPALVGHVELNAIELDTATPTPEAMDAVIKVLGSGTVTAVFVAIDDDTAALSAALTIRQRLADQPCRIHVRTRLDSGLAVLMSDDRVGGLKVTLTSFGLLDRTCTAEVVDAGTNEQVAEAIHADYLSRTQRAGQTGPWVVPWADLPSEGRESNRRVADNLVGALRSIGCRVNPLYGWDDAGFAFTDDEVEGLAQREHERWAQERRTDGWRYGPSRDAVAKTNPLLVAWDELPEGDRESNRETVRGWPALLARAGFELVR
jgi:hypothetical protein